MNTQLVANHTPRYCERAAFDAAAWLADWSDHGGIVMRIGERLWIGRMPCLDRAAARRLDAIRAPIMRPDAVTALSGALRGLREAGEGL